MTDTMQLERDHTVVTDPSRREEAKAQRVLLRHKTVPAILRHIAYTEGFVLTDDLIDTAFRILSTQTVLPTATATLHQMRSALYKAEMAAAVS